MNSKKRRSLRYLIVLTVVIFMLAGCAKSGSKDIEDKKIIGQCSLLVECSSVLEHMDKLKDGLESVIPEDGAIYENRKVDVYENDTAFSILSREMKANKILMESSFTAGTNSAYVEGINNLYEFDCGEMSGWMYKVNGDNPAESCSDYKINGGDEIVWIYTCSLEGFLE